MSLPFFSISSEKATYNHLVHQTKALLHDQIKSKIGSIVKVCIANRQDSPFDYDHWLSGVAGQLRPLKPCQAY